MLDEEVAFNLMTLPSLNSSPWPGGTREPTPSKTMHVVVAKPVQQIIFFAGFAGVCND